MAENNKKFTIDEKKSELVYTLEINGKEWEKLYADAKAKEVKNIKIPGFRPGKAPQHEIEKRVNPLSVASEAVDQYWRNNHDRLKEELLKENKRIAFIPKMNLKDLDPKKGATLEITFPLLPDFEKIQIKSPKTKFELIKIEKKDIEDWIAQQLEKNALLLPLKKDEKTKAGDTVTIDYKGFIKDEPFDGGEAQGFDLKLGSHTFIDTFEDQLIGKKIGWKGEVKVTFPKEYAVEKLKGQPATFEVEIKDAKRREKVELTDKNFGTVRLARMSEAKNAAEVKKEVQLLLEIGALDESIENYFNELVEEFDKKNDFIIHKTFVEDDVKKSLSELESNLKQQKIKLHEYLELLGQTKEQLMDLLAKDHSSKVKKQTISTEIVKQVKPEFDKDKFAFRILSLAYNTGLDTKFIEDTFFDEKGETRSGINAMDTLKTFIIIEKVLEKFDKNGFATYLKSKEALSKELDKRVKAYTKKREEELAKVEKEAKEEESKPQPAKKAAAKKSTKNKN